MDALCHIELFGGLRVRQGERLITRFRTQKVGALLAYLAYHRDDAHPREVLVELLWPGCLPDAGRNSLRVALSSLRHQLEPPGVPSGAVIAADRLFVRLNPAGATTDVAAFQDALREAGGAGSIGGRIRGLAAAVERYRGELLSGYYEDWVIQEQRRVAEAFFQGMGRLIGYLEKSGDLEGALAYARRGISADPLREAPHHALMRLHLAMGHPREALAQVVEWERIAREELRAEPSEAVRALARRLREQRPTEAPPSPAQPEIHPNAQDRSFVSDAQGDGSQGDPSRRTLRMTDPGGRSFASESDAQDDRSQADPTSGNPKSQIPNPKSLPTGSVTFLLAGLEGSAVSQESALPPAVETAIALLSRELRRQGGWLVKEWEHGALAAFECAGDALVAAVAAQRALGAPGGLGAARLALYTGDAEVRGGEYRAAALDRASRALAAGHQGQILCSEETAGLARWGLEPGVRLVDLGVYRLQDLGPPERLFQVEHPDVLRREFPPLRAAAGHPCNLPPALSRFFGRREELSCLREWLLDREIRLVTLTGVGGAGKTRLALEAARSLVAEHGGAVWLVPLADLEAGRMFPDAVLESLRLPHVPGMDPLEQVASVLLGRPCLLVFDNLEHVVDEGARVIEALLARVPSLTCVATSRRRLSLEGEREMLVHPLPVPRKQGSPDKLMEFASVRLFVDRAQAVRPDFQLTHANATTVAGLCRRLDGIPLALELAAARAQVLTPAQLLDQLGRGLDPLASRRRDLSERHRTLRSAMDWSYHLLSPELQDLFGRLSVFRGGWSPHAVEAVAGDEYGPGLDVLDLLAQLRECSLVLSEEIGAEMRFRMLETLRECAAEKLGQCPDGGRPSRDRHAAYFLRFTQACLAEMRTSREAAALQRLDADLDNLRAALEWALEAGAGTVAAHLALALGTFLWRRGLLTEARRCTQAGVQALGDTPSGDALTHAGLLLLCARVAIDRFEWEHARQCARDALILCTPSADGRRLADAHNLLGLVARGMKDPAQAADHFAAAADRFRDVGDESGQAAVLTNLGLLGLEEEGGDRDAAARHWQEALAIRRAQGDRRGMAEVLTNLGILAQGQGNLPEAARHYEDALRLEQELRHALGIARALANRGEVADLEGDFERAGRLFAAAEYLFAQAGSPYQGYVAGLLTRISSRSEAGAAAIAALREAARDRALDDLIGWAATPAEC